MITRKGVEKEASAKDDRGRKRGRFVVDLELGIFFNSVALSVRSGPGIFLAAAQTSLPATQKITFKTSMPFAHSIQASISLHIYRPTNISIQ